MKKYKVRINWDVFVERVIAPIVCFLLACGMWAMLVDLFARGW